MGYIADIDDPDDHEGWIAMTYADGKVSSGTSSAFGVYLDGYAYLADQPGEIDPSFLRPFADTKGWLVRCECGWRGVEVEVPDTLDELGQKYREPSGEQEWLLMAQWRVHIRDDVKAA